jgi:hypothetical protein
MNVRAPTPPTLIMNHLLNFKATPILVWTPTLRVMTISRGNLYQAIANSNRKERSWQATLTRINISPKLLHRVMGMKAHSLTIGRTVHIPTQVTHKAMLK